MAKRKKTNNDLLNTTKKIKDWEQRTPRKTGGELMCFGTVSSSCSTSSIRRVTLDTNPVITYYIMGYRHLYLQWSKFVRLYNTCIDLHSPFISFFIGSQEITEYIIINFKLRCQTFPRNIIQLFQIWIYFTLKNML